MSAIFKLPLEILEDIVDICHLDAQLSLCRASKLFHSLTIHFIYRDISLVTPSSVVTCCRTLTVNLSAAAAVKSFSISYTPIQPFNARYCFSFYSIIGKALQSLSQLQDLRLLVIDPNYILVLNNLQCPGLWHFECYLALTAPLILFLNRHPDINYLQIAPNEALSLSSPIGALPHVVLPKLEYFIGNNECVSALVSRASLRAAFVFWDAVDAAPQHAIMALERSSGNTMNLLSCRRRGWNLDLMDLISTWLPNLYVLSITNLLIVDSHPSDAFLDTVKGYLRRFSVLRHLHIHCVDVWKMGAVECRMDHDFATVTAWGAACPSLTECTLPHSNGMKWVRLLDDVWLPDPSDPQGVAWLWDMLNLERYPHWNKVVLAIGQRIRDKGVHSLEFEGTIAGLRALTLRDAWVDEDDRLGNDSVEDGGRGEDADDAPASG